MRIGVCPGSFDPVTNGHVDIFERGSRLVDKLIIAVSSNPNKNSLFTMEERVEMIQNSVKHIPNIETVFIMTNNKYSFVSSTGIRELAKFGGKLDGLVPDDVKEKLEERFNTVHNK